MKSKAVNVIVILATVSSALAALMHILIYYLAQEAVLEAFMDTSQLSGNTRVPNYSATVCVLVIAAAYLAACIITISAKEYRIGWGICLITLCFHIILNMVQNRFLSLMSAQDAAREGVEYLAVFSSLNAARSYIEVPFSTYALVLLCIAFGMLCILKNFEKE